MKIMNSKDIQLAEGIDGNYWRNFNREGGRTSRYKVSNTNQRYDQITRE